MPIVCPHPEEVHRERDPQASTCPSSDCVSPSPTHAPRVFRVELTGPVFHALCTHRRRPAKYREQARLLPRSSAGLHQAAVQRLAAAERMQNANGRRFPGSPGGPKVEMDAPTDTDAAQDRPLLRLNSVTGTLSPPMNAASADARPPTEGQSTHAALRVSRSSHSQTSPWR